MIDRSIERRHKLIRSTDSTFEFAHHKIRETIYTDLPTELRKIYHLKTAGCLEQDLAEKTSDGYLADIALHYVEGGAPEKAFQYLRSIDVKCTVRFQKEAQIFEKSVSQIVSQFEKLVSC